LQKDSKLKSEEFENQKQLLEAKFREENNMERASYEEDLEEERRINLELQRERKFLQ